MALTTRNLTLSNGAEMEVKEISLYLLIDSGLVPNALLPIVRGALVGKPTAVAEIEEALQTNEQIQQYVGFYIMYAKKAALSPKIVDREPDVDEINIWDMTDTDFFKIFLTSQGKVAPEIKAMSSFPDEQESDTSPAEDEPELSEATE